jgi:signal transduction histidine kinase
MTIRPEARCRRGGSGRLGSWLLAVWMACLPLWAGATETLTDATVCESLDEATACTPKPAALPYHWDLAHDLSDGSARFTLHFDSRALLPADASAGRSVPAVFMPRIGNAYSVELNGLEVAAVGAPRTQRFDTVKRPQLVLLPPERVRERNDLVITIHAQAGRAAQLSQVSVGPQSELLPAFERERFWRVQVTATLMWMGWVLGLMSLAVWLVQREPMFLAYAIAEIAWSLRLAEMFPIEMPFDWQGWGAGVATLFGISQLAMTYFFLNAVGRWGGRLRRGYWTYVGLWVVMVPLVVSLRLRVLWIAWLGAGTLMFVALALFVAWHSFKERHFWRWMFASFVLSMVVAGVYDMLESPGSMYMHPTATRLVWGGFSVGLALLVGRRLHRAREDLLASKIKVEAALAQQAIELRAAHQLQARNDVAQAMAEERQRVMRDMHDGLGAQLSGLLSTVARAGATPQELQAQVRSAIDELRMVVDAMVPFDGNLAGMLGSLRPRLERHLALNNIRLEWAVDDLPALPNLSPLHVQHLQRFLLEAVNNIARHSQAHMARLSARSLGPAVELQLTDDGVGFVAQSPDGNASPGNGMRNLCWRAEALGAQLCIDGQWGTSLRLVLPIES